MRLSQNPEYTRAVAGGNNLSGSSSCWLGGNHLLIVETQFNRESYRRIRYADMRGLLVHPTRAGLFRFLLLGLPSLLLGLVLLGLGLFLRSSAVDPDFSSGFPEFCFYLAFLLIAFFGFSLFTLKTCAIHIQTTAQQIRIPGLVSRRKVNQLVRALLDKLSAFSNTSVNPQTTGPSARNHDAPNPAS